MEIKLNTKTILWVVLAIIIIVVLWQTLQLSSLGSAAASAPQSYGGMVGGC